MYDLRKLDDWEDTTLTADDAQVDDANEEEEEEETDVEKTLRTTKKFDFEIADFAVDPGMDLLVVVEIR